MAASAHGPDPDTVIFRAQTPSGVEEEIVVQLDSESKWQAWVGAGMGTRLEVPGGDHTRVGGRREC
jgi:hypothetical protein